MKLVFGISILTLLTFQIIIALWHASPDYDERASIDISLGVRPNIILDKNGDLTTDLNYRNISGKINFSNSDYFDMRTSENVLKSVMKDNSNSFVYYLLLQKWNLLFGVSLFKMRVFSVIASLLSLIIFFEIIRKLVPDNNIMPWIGTLLLYGNPFFLESSCAIRGYIFAILFSLLVINSLIQIRNKTNNGFRYLVLVGFSCLAVLTHYYILAVIIPCLIFLTILIVKRRQSLIEKICICSSVAVLVAASVYWIYICSGEGLFWLHKFNITVKVLSRGTPYSLTIFNLLRQLIYFMGIVLAPAGKLNEIPAIPRIAYLIFSIFLLTIFFVKNRVSIPQVLKLKESRILFTFGFVPLILYVLQACYSSQLTVFLPHYIVFLLPGAYLTMLMVVQGLNVSKGIDIAWLYLICIISGNIIANGVFIKQAYQATVLDKRQTEIAVEKIRSNKSNKLVLVFSDMNLNSVEQMAEAIRDNKELDSITFNNAKDAQMLNYFLKSDRISQKISPNQ